MKNQLNPRIALHTTRFTLSRICLSPITSKYINIFNVNNHKELNKTKTFKDALSTHFEAKLTPKILLKEYVNIPNRGIGKTKEIIPHLHLNFKLLWVQQALLLNNKADEELYQIVCNVPSRYLDKKINITKRKGSNTTLIKELLRSPVVKMPNNIKFWAVFEKGTENGGNHVHIIISLKPSDKDLIKAALSVFQSVKFKVHTTINGEQHPIDIGAAYYYAKTVNKKYFGVSNVYISPTLNRLSREVEVDYKSFVTVNKNFLLNDKKEIDKAIQSYDQARRKTIPTTLEQWEEKNLVETASEVIDPSVYWGELE